MKTDIRRYQASDEDAVVNLLARVLPDDQAHNEPRHTLSEKSRHDGDMQVSVQQDQDGVLITGFVMYGYDGHRGWIYQLAVDPAHRRKGLGESLVTAALSALEAQGCEKVNLQVRADNEGVATFYRTLGFAVEDRISMGLLFNRQA